MIVYVTIAVMVPRMYLLLHFPTDIIAGGIIGSACVMIASIAGGATRFGRMLVDRLYAWSMAHAPTFYAAMFIWSFEVAELFDSVRRLAQIGPVLKALVAAHH
jgi:undecaprenyl-diphosphatase